MSRGSDIGETLQGTCMSLEEGCQQHGISEDDLTEADHHEIDDTVFNCNGCGWWCETCEEVESDDGPMCNDCGPSDE